MNFSYLMSYHLFVQWLHALEKDFVEVMVIYRILFLTMVFQLVDEFVRKIQVRNQDQDDEQQVHIIYMKSFIWKRSQEKKINYLSDRQDNAWRIFAHDLSWIWPVLSILDSWRRDEVDESFEDDNSLKEKYHLALFLVLVLHFYLSE